MSLEHLVVPERKEVFKNGRHDFLDTETNLKEKKKGTNAQNWKNLTKNINNSSNPNNKISILESILIEKMERQMDGWMDANHKSDKGLGYRIHKEFLYFNNKKSNNPTFKWAKDFIRHFSKKDIPKANKCMKRH